MNDAWILLNSGNTLRPFYPVATDIHIEDIAHALANQCRFSGHTSEFYSVAQHSELVSNHVGDDPMTQLWALLHDAGEAYIGDMASPIKAHFPEFQHMESRLQVAIADAFGLPSHIPDEVWVADRLLLSAEWRDLMPDGIALPGAVKAQAVPKIIPKDPKMARMYFINRFHTLQQALKASA